MIKYNSLLNAVKAAFPGYKIDPSAGSVSVVNKLQSISFAIRSTGEIAVYSSVSGLQVDLAQWEKFEDLDEAIIFGLSVVIKPEDQPVVDLTSPEEQSYEEFDEPEVIVDRPELV